MQIFKKDIVRPGTEQYNPGILPDCLVTALIWRLLTYPDNGYWISGQANKIGVFFYYSNREGERSRESLVWSLESAKTPCSLVLRGEIH